MKFLSALFFRFFMYIIGLLPYRLLYVLSDFLRFLLQRVIKYRTAVVEDNLRKSFPEKSEEELKRIEKLSYKNLSDMLMEGFRAFTMSRKQAIRRFKITNQEILDQFKENEQSVMLVLGHYADWELAALGAPYYLGYENLITFYKPLKNPYTDKFIQKNRSREGVTLASIKVTAATFKKYQDAHAMYILVADQSPSNLNKAIWVPFLNRDTAFLHGPEQYATDYKLPIVFVDIQRVKRGFYEGELSVLTTEPEKLPAGEITRLYAAKLEEIIYKKPEDWLWSHKRWKHTRK